MMSVLQMREASSSGRPSFCGISMMFSTFGGEQGGGVHEGLCQPAGNALNGAINPRGFQQGIAEQSHAPTCTPVQHPLPLHHPPTCCSSSWLSAGCLLIDCGSTTVSSSGFSARSAPRITAALVPVAPLVKMWLPCGWGMLGGGQGEDSWQVASEGRWWGRQAGSTPTCNTAAYAQL